MLYLFAIIAALATTAHTRPPDAGFDCPMRQMALEFAASIQPNLSMEQLQEIADALNGAREALNCSVSPSHIDFASLGLVRPPPSRSAPVWDDLTPDNLARLMSDKSVAVLFVDTAKGDDLNNGNTLNTPFKTIHGAIEKSRNFDTSILKYIVLRQGKYFIDTPISLTEADSNLIITNFNGEVTEMTGAATLTCNWKLYRQEQNGKNTYTCSLADSANNDKITSITGLRVNGQRGIRARYPNANPETDGFGSDLYAISWVPPVNENPQPDFNFNPNYPSRIASADGEFSTYSIGMGGSCKDQFTPPAGYWCSAQTQGGGGFTYRIPTGMNYNRTIFPHSPYANAIDGVIQTWRPGHWSSWMFEIGQDSPKNGHEQFLFSKGGFQGARGDNTGDNMYVENVFEELDMETEWFYNKSERILYYRNNGTSSPDSIVFEATQTKVLISAVGNQTNPYMNFVLRGQTLRDTAYTYMGPHGMPSGGDWALARTGAVYLDGVDGVTIDSNMFTRCDGNAISINRYARNVVITGNEVVWNGDNVISQWGDTQGITFPSGTTADNSSMGWDGSNGNQPRGTVIKGNLVHEIGIWEKQSSFYFQAKSMMNELSENIFFNGPRAGINFNDGFGGGSVIKKNLLFNTCRESGDHGPFNSWDRQVYTYDDTMTTVKKYDEISQNFMIANYNSQEAIDNDDGSCYYRTSSNFFCYSGNGMKNDFGGHDNIHEFNIYAYVGKGFGIVSTSADHRDEFTNNTVVLYQDAENYGTFHCGDPQDQWPILGDNVVCTPSGDVDKTGLCNLDEAAFQKKYQYDLTTVIQGLPSDTDLLNQAHALLFD